MNEKADILTQKLIDRFCLLEQYIPRANKGNYKPTKVPVLWDVLETQDIAYEMMCFAGLNEYTPQIRFEKMKEGVAGYITLNNSSSKIVYINISEAERVTFPYRIISILAHEICHKVLYINHFPYLDGIENERYTDLCTYYLGFGFYTTEGYENYITADVYGKSIILGQKVIGYLSEKTIARAYIISQLCMNQPFNDCSRRKELVERMARVDDLSALIKYRSKVITNDFKYIDFYRIVCPQCGFVSSVSSQNNYRKKFVCKHCGEEFYFTWYIYDNDNPIYKYVPSSTKIDFNPKSPSFLDRIRKWFRKIF